MSPQPPDDTVGTKEAAALLGVSKRTVHRLVDDGMLVPLLTAPGGPHGSYIFLRSAVHEESARAAARREERYQRGRDGSDA